MKTILLLDGDILLYELAHSYRQEVVFDDVVTPTLDLREASQGADSRIAEIKEHFGGDKVVIAFSWRGDHWRQRVLPSYKSGRKDRPQKPLGYWQLRQYLQEAHPCEDWEPLEADDVLGLLSTNPKTGRAVVVSTDKDLRTIPGLYANAWDGEIEVITETDADRFFMLQTLMGDQTDGYKGCPGIGKVKARKIVDPLEDMVDLWHAVVLAYEGAGLGEEEALQTARVARILRHGEYNLKTKEIKLWEPPR